MIGCQTTRPLRTFHQFLEISSTVMCKTLTLEEYIVKFQFKSDVSFLLNSKKHELTHSQILSHNCKGILWVYQM